MNLATEVRALLHTGAAINAENFAVDPLAVLRRQEADHPSNVNRQADSVYWRPPGSILPGD